MTVEKPKRKQPKAIVLTSHPGGHGPKPIPVTWGAADPAVRGPLVATVTHRAHRNVIGTHSGSYAVYRALAVAAGALNPLTQARPHQHGADRPGRAVPAVGRSREDRLAGPVGRGRQRRVSPLLRRRATTSARPSPSPRPTFACPRSPTRSRAGRLQPDGTVLRAGGDVSVTKAAIEPVWYLPGVAQRFGCAEADLRRALFEHTGGMFPELVTRSDLEVFLPPIGGHDHLHVRRRHADSPTREAAHRFACTTSATARTSSARTSAPAAPTWRMGSRSACATAQGGGVGRDRLLPQGRAGARRGDEVPGVQRAQAPGGRRSAPTSTSPAPSASPACRTCDSRS